MNKLKIIISIIIQFFIFIQTFGANDILTYGIISDTGKSFCYKFLLKNPTNTIITSWQIDFKLDKKSVIKSKWGGNFSNNGINYTITGLDWNSTIDIGATNIEIGFCADGKNKPENVVFINNTPIIINTTPPGNSGNTPANNDTPPGNSGNQDNNCSKMTNESSCIGGNSKDICIWLNNSCVDINTQVKQISDINLVKNWGFEIYSEANILLKLWENLLRFIGILSDIPDWTSINSEYKLWKNSNVKSAEGIIFLELIDKNILYQNIPTISKQKYYLSFYNMGTETLEVQWNGKIIHKNTSPNTWTKYQYLIEGIAGTSKLEFNAIVNGKQTQDLKVAIDYIGLNEVTFLDKLDLMTLINDNLINTVSNNSCSEIFYLLEDQLKTDLIQRLLSGQDYQTIANDFLNSIGTSSIFNIVKNQTYPLVIDKITITNTQEEIDLFYNEVYNQTINKITTCVLNNINTQVNKEVITINYLKGAMDTCSLSGNTITLKFLNNYSIYK